MRSHLNFLPSVLLLLAAAISAGAIVELWAADHTEEPIQWLLFFLCGLSLDAVVAALLRPRPGVLVTMRSTMTLMVPGSLLGIYEHVAGNTAFAQEICPDTAGGDVLSSSLGNDGSAAETKHVYYALILPC